MHGPTLLRVRMVQITFNLIDDRVLSSHDTSLFFHEPDYDVFMLDLRKVQFVGSGGLLWISRLKHMARRRSMQFCIVVSSTVHLRLLCVTRVLDEHDGLCVLQAGGT